MGTPKPKLIAFDLDYTLWPFWVDTHVDPPFRKDAKGKVFDSVNRRIKPYPEISDVLKKLHDEGYILAVASRSSDPEGANQLLELYDWDKYFTIKEIYPGCKITHFKRIKEKTGVSFDDMLFFDDEYRNKLDMNRIGVLMIMVKDGVDHKLIAKGLEEFAEPKKIIKEKTGVSFEDMLFFDDEYGNKIDLMKIGVLMIMVDDGTTHELIANGLKEFAKSKDMEVE